MLSYMVLCGRLEQVLPGSRTIPEQISESKAKYYDALEAADKCYKDGSVDVSKMETLLENYLANQLVDVHEQARGGQITGSSVAFSKSTFGDWIESKPVLITGAIALIGIIASIWLSLG